jgi:hypothetical protein|tara:strand:+ start:537 stop:719 length:183 start_codon:yes stop_codon:yes gene_type:complete
MSELFAFLLGGGITWFYCLCSTLDDIDNMSVSDFKALKKDVKRFEEEYQEAMSQPYTTHD